MPDLIRAFMLVQRGLPVNRGIWQPFNDVRSKLATLSPEANPVT
jgi:hypothetical protein